MNRIVILLLIMGMLLGSCVVQASETDQETVRAVQEALNQSGFDCGNPDGVFGSKTEGAIRQYQESNGLAVDGTISEELLLAMGLSGSSEQAQDSTSVTTAIDNEQAWDQLYSFVSENGTEIDGMKGIKKIGDPYTTYIAVAEGDSENIYLVTKSDSNVMDVSLTLMLKKNEGNAEFRFVDRTELADYGFDVYNEKRASGHVDISTITSQTELNPETFEYESKDINGNVETISDMSKYYSPAAARVMLSDLPVVLSAAGLDISMKDLGFYANLSQDYGIELREHEKPFNIVGDVYTIIPDDWMLTEGDDDIIKLFPPENSEQTLDHFIMIYANKVSDMGLTGEYGEQALDSFMKAFQKEGLTLTDEQKGVEIGGFQGRNAHVVMSKSTGDCDISLVGFLVNEFKECYLVCMNYQVGRDVDPKHDDVFQRMLDTIYVDTDGSFTASLISGGTLSETESESTEADTDSESEKNEAVVETEGSESEKNEAVDTTEESGSGVHEVDHITVSCDGGLATLAGWQYPPEGFLDKPYTEDQCFVALVDYTNLEDAEKRMENDFMVRAYQNGVELDKFFCIYFPDTFKEGGNFNKSVIKDGKIRVAWWYLLEDDSPVTVVISEQGASENNAKTEILL